MLKNLNKTLLVFALAFSFAKAQDVSIAVGDTAFAGSPTAIDTSWALVKEKAKAKTNKVLFRFLNIKNSFKIKCFIVYKNTIRLIKGII